MEEKVLRVIDDYKKSADIEDDVIQASAYTYEIGFNDYKAKVKELFLGLDLCKVITGGEGAIGEAVKEGEVQEEVAEEVIAEEVALQPLPLKC